MQRFDYPKPADWATLLQRPAADWGPFRAAVTPVLAAVRTTGDTALRSYTQQYDGVAVSDFRVPEAALAGASAEVSAELFAAIGVAIQNVRAFHEAQRPQPVLVETQPGVHCRLEYRPIERVGLYVPGGSAPLFSSLIMLGVPAVLAACKTIVVCSPPQPNGQVHPAVRAIAQVLGLREVFAVGGAQAIAALAYGTASVPKVDKIFGPGNAYVAAAKQLVQLDGTATDLPAGPSEVLVVADAAANPVHVAADLLSQAEHGPDSQVVLVTDNNALLEAVLKEVARQVAELPRREIAQAALQHARAILVHNLAEAMAFSNAYAPEHLILNVAEPEALAQEVRHAGSVFLGRHTPESVGDYASGTNHTLPTHGYARAYSGVGLGAFLKTVTFQQLSAAGLKALGPHVIHLAEAEGLAAHANAVRYRVSSAQDV